MARSTVDLWERHDVFRRLALKLDDAQNGATKAKSALILNRYVVFDFDVHLLDEADGDFGCVVERITQSDVGDGFGESFDTQNLNDLCGAVIHEERDFPVA